MEFLREFFQLIGTNEAILSGIAAGIVILGVVLTAFRGLFGRRSRTDALSSSSQVGVAPAPTLQADSPSIAVMPFANLSGDPEQDFLADGLTEDIIFGLSRVKQLFVIARNTCFTYKGTTPDTQVVSPSKPKNFSTNNQHSQRWNTSSNMQGLPQLLERRALDS